MTKQGWITRKLNGNGTAWNKGLTRKDDLRIAQPWLGKKRPEIKEFFTMKGKKASPETRKKLSEIKKGKKPSNFGVSFGFSGNKNINWNGGITPENLIIRKSAAMRRWRKLVFERDNYTCTQCGKIGGDLNADHIKSFCAYPKLRFDVGNGRTLCVQCHRQTDTYSKHLSKYTETLYA